MKNRIPFLTTTGGILVGYLLLSPLSVYVSHRMHQEEAIRQIGFWAVYSHESFVWSVPFIVFGAAMGLLVGLLYRKNLGKTEKIQEAREYIDLMLNSLDEGMLSIGRDYRIIRANRAYLNQVGAGRADRVEGELCYRVSHRIDTPCYEAGEDCPVRKVFETGAAAKASHVHRDNIGGAVYVDLSAYPVRDAAGNVVQALEVIRNVTEHRKAEEALRRYAEELRRSNLFKDLFTDILSHDLLNPVGVIKYMADSLAADPDIKDQTRVSMLKRNVQKLQEMIQNTAKYARLEGADRLEMREQDLTALLRVVINALQASADEKEMSIIFEPPQEARTFANPMLEDVFFNIIANAIKYAPETTPITVTIADGGDSWSVAVADQGGGIPPEYRENIFERFVRRNKEGVKGSGLGLAIARRIVVAHGGSIGVGDNPGGGSIFTVFLPKKPGGRSKGSGYTSGDDPTHETDPCPPQ